MTKAETQAQEQQATIENITPPGYPAVNSPDEGMKKKKKKKKGFFRIKKRGDKGFIEGCLAGLCCCWICEECCC